MAVRFSQSFCNTLIFKTGFIAWLLHWVEVHWLCFYTTFSIKTGDHLQPLNTCYISCISGAIIIRVEVILLPSENSNLMHLFLCLISPLLSNTHLPNTFFLCSFWRSLKVSIFFTSSFNISDSWMWKFPMFSISETKKIQTAKWIIWLINTCLAVTSRRALGLTALQLFQWCPQGAESTTQI